MTHNVKRALIVVDMLKDFAGVGGALFCGPAVLAIIENIVKKVHTAIANGETVIFLCDSHAEDDLEFLRFLKHAVEGTEGAELIAELMEFLSSEYCVVIKKTRYSGFYKTQLANLLQNLDITDIEVTGVCTHICVMDTVGGLANRDYNITVARDSIADFNDEAAGAAINDRLWAQLKPLNIVYDHLFSITSHHQKVGTKVEWKDSNNPMIDPKIWDRTKADYCKKHGITIHIDDSDEYGKYFSEDIRYVQYEKGVRNMVAVLVILTFVVGIYISKRNQ